MSTENSLSLFFFFLSDSVSSGRSVVIENRQNVLSTKTNTALLMSPLERSARFVQASWRRRLCMLYPKRYKERQQQQQQQQPALSAVMSSPFVTVSVTSSKKSSVSSSGRVMEESGGGGGGEMTNMDANTKVTTLCIGLSNMEITTMWKELGYPILRSMRGEQDNDLFDQARAAASAAAIAPGGESSERSEGSEGSSNSTTALTSGDDPAVAVAAASDASGGGGGEEGSPVSVLRCCCCCRCCCLLFLKCFQLHQLTSCF